MNVNIDNYLMVAISDNNGPPSRFTTYRCQDGADVASILIYAK